MRIRGLGICFALCCCLGCSSHHGDVMAANDRDTNPAQELGKARRGFGACGSSEIPFPWRYEGHPNDGHTVMLFRINGAIARFMLNSRADGKAWLSYQDKGASGVRNVWSLELLSKKPFRESREGTLRRWLANQGYYPSKPPSLQVAKELDSRESFAAYHLDTVAGDMTYWSIDPSGADIDQKRVFIKYSGDIDHLPVTEEPYPLSQREKAMIESKSPANAGQSSP